MNGLVARTHLHHAVLCIFIAVGLTACGEDQLSNNTDTIAAAGSSPTIEGVPPVAVNSGSTYAFTPTASDPHGEPIIFGIVNKPQWASFDTTTGRLSGTPTDADIGDTVGVGITASNKRARSSIGP